MWSLAAVAAFGARNASAEDIGREPLAPLERPAAAPAETANAAVAGPRGAFVVRGADHVAAREAGPQRRWYGWQTLLVDAIPTIGLLAMASSRRSSGDELLGPITATFILGGPIVHAAHGHIGKAVLSLGVRSAGPLLIGIAASGTHNGSDNQWVALGVLGVLAIPAAIIIDASAIAREDVPRSDASLLRRVAAAPWVDPKRGAAGVSASLSF
jgi:hypothetical protein